MNRIRTIRRLACVLTGLASALLLAFTAAAPAAFAYRLPPSGGPQTAAPAILRLPPLPPGWYKHPPLPASPTHAHAVATAGMTGWQLTLIAAAAALLAAAVLAVTAYRMRAARRSAPARA